MEPEYKKRRQDPVIKELKAKRVYGLKPQPITKKQETVRKNIALSLIDQTADTSVCSFSSVENGKFTFKLVVTKAFC